MAALASAYDHVNWTPALLLSDAGYDLRFGLFALGLGAPGLLSPLLLLSDAGLDMGFGRFGSSPRPCELEARSAY